MEQYEMLPLGGFKLLRQILPYWKPEHILVRTCGGNMSHYGSTIIDESLEGRSFVVRRRHNGLVFVIDGKERYCVAVERKKSEKNRGRGWGLGYERLTPDDTIDMQGTGYPNPDDPTLPKIHRSILHCAKDGIYTRITFPGKIPIRKLWQIYPDQDWWCYWEVVLPRE